MPMLGVVAKVKNRRHSVLVSKKSVMVSIQKCGIIVLVSNQIEYRSNYLIQFKN